MNLTWKTVSMTASRRVQHSLQSSRKAVMQSQAKLARPSPRRRSKKVFNLDVHISVIADLAVEMRYHKIRMTRWSLSSHNFVTRRLFRGPDPVDVVNAETWTSLDDNMIDEFQNRYRRFLNSFDGFVCTYPPAFAELYRDLGKPILVVAATRYEAPYTRDCEQWRRFNEYLLREMAAGRMIMAANNRADQDYIRFHLTKACFTTCTVCQEADGVDPLKSWAQGISGRIHLPFQSTSLFRTT